MGFSAPFGRRTRRPAAKLPFGTSKFAGSAIARRLGERSRDGIEGIAFEHLTADRADEGHQAPVAHHVDPGLLPAQPAAGGHLKPRPHLLAGLVLPEALRRPKP